MIIYIISFLITWSEDLIAYYIAANFTDKYKLSLKSYIKISIVLGLGCLAMYTVLVNHPLLIVLTGQFMGFFVCAQFEETFLNKLTLFITVLLIMFTSELPPYIFMFFCTKYNILSNLYLETSIAHVMTLFILFFAFKTRIRTLYNKVLTSSFVYKIVLIYFYIFLVSTLVPAQAEHEYLYNNIWLTLFAILFTFICSIILLYFEKIIKQKNTDLIYYKKNIPIYEELIHGIRTSQHEFVNRTQALNILLTESKDLNSIRDTLISCTSEYALPVYSYEFLKLNMPLLASSFYALTHTALAMEKRLEFSILNYELESNVSETVLSDITNTLFQNILKISKTNTPVYVTIDSTNKQFILEIKNPVNRYYSDAELHDFFRTGYMSEELSVENTDNWNLYSVLKTVQKNRGKLQIICSENDREYWITTQMRI